MKKSLYKRMEKNTTAWDLTASCRQFVFNNKNRRSCAANRAKQSTDSLTKTLLDKLQIL